VKPSNSRFPKFGLIVSEASSALHIRSVYCTFKVFRDVPHYPEVR